MRGSETHPGGHASTAASTLPLRVAVRMLRGQQDNRPPQELDASEGGSTHAAQKRRYHLNNHR